MNSHQIHHIHCLGNNDHCVGKGEGGRDKLGTGRITNDILNLTIILYIYIVKTSEVT